MKANIAIVLGVVAVIIAAYAAWPDTLLFGSANCQGGVTCYTDLAATNSFESEGTTALDSTLGVTATTTLSDTVNFNNPALCINFYATSTATRLHLVASTTATLPGAAAAVMTAEYGACTN